MSQKEYRVLNIMETTMNPSNFEVFVCELAEVTFKMKSFDNSGYFYNFNGEGELYVIPSNSKLGAEAIECLHNESVLELDLSDFYSRMEYKKGRNQRIWYHNKVVH